MGVKRGRAVSEDGESHLFGIGIGVGLGRDLDRSCSRAVAQHLERPIEAFFFAWLKRRALKCVRQANE